MLESVNSISSHDRASVDEDACMYLKCSGRKIYVAAFRVSTLSHAKPGEPYFRKVSGSEF